MLYPKAIFHLPGKYGKETPPYEVSLQISYNKLHQHHR